MLDQLSSNDFMKHLNSVFSLTCDSGEYVKVKLIEVSELHINDNNDINRNDKRRRPFSIVFSGPPHPVLPQGIHTLGHSEMQSLNLFVVPIGMDSTGMRYEAVFN